MGMIKNSFEVEQLRTAGRISGQIVFELSKMVQPGVSALEVDARAWELCKEHGVEPTFYGYEGYKYATCISVNDEVVHSLPTANKIFAEGDLVKIDFGARYNGYCADHCRTFAVGKITEAHKRLLEVGRAATFNAVAAARLGNTIGDISWQMQNTAQAAGFDVVKMYVGHGIGKKMHEPPEVPAFGEAGTGISLQENMVICVECQVIEGSDQVLHDADGWTTRTKDGGWAVMFEQMIRITKDEPEVLSIWPDNPTA